MFKVTPLGETPTHWLTISPDDMLIFVTLDRAGLLPHLWQKEDDELSKTCKGRDFIYMSLIWIVLNVFCLCWFQQAETNTSSYTYCQMLQSNWNTCNDFLVWYFVIYSRDQSDTILMYTASAPFVWEKSISAATECLKLGSVLYLGIIHAASMSGLGFG